MINGGAWRTHRATEKVKYDTGQDTTIIDNDNMTRRNARIHILCDERIWALRGSKNRYGSLISVCARWIGM